MKLNPIAKAVRLLREAAAEYAEGVSINGVPDWANEPDTHAAYLEHMAAADALETMPNQCLHQIAEPAAKAAPLTDAQIDAVFDCLPDGPQGFMRKWGYQQFARKIMSLYTLVEWPKDAYEVRTFMDGNCQVEKYANDDGHPNDDDVYQLSAHDFLSAINWWADYPNRQLSADPTPAEQAAWFAGLDEGRAQRDAAPAAVAVPDELRAALQWCAGGLKAVAPERDTLRIGAETKTVGQVLDEADAALAAAPAAAPAGWKLVPVQVPDSAFPWVSGGYSTDYRAHDPRDQKIIEDRAQRTWAAILDGIVATPAAADSESVLIEGAAYDVPAAVAGELLRLHLEIRAATPAAAAPVVLPEPGINTANHVGIRVVGYTEQQVRALLAGVSEPAVDPIQAAADAASVGHLSHLVDHQTALLARAMAAMKAVEHTATPIDESRGDLDARIPEEAWAAFVNARAALLHDVAQSPVAAPTADALNDSALLDAMEQKRIAVVPEYEGPWDAEVYNEDGKPNHLGSGSTPREAIRAAIAAQAAAKEE